MRRTTFAALLLAALPLTVTTAQAPNKPRPTATAGDIRPGTYDLEVESGGGVLQGTLVLTTTGDSLTARLRVGEHEPPVRGLTRKGSHLTLSGGGEGMQIVYQLDFDGDRLEGSYVFNGNPGVVTGKRRT